MSDDEKVSQKYRELGAPEPPRALDEAILAAATRSARSLHGTARSWTKRWAVPLSIAAVVVLSATVTLRIQHEQSGIEVPAPTEKERAAAPPVVVAEPQLTLKAEEQFKAPTRERRAKTAGRDETRRDETRQAEPKPFAQPMRDQVPAAAPAAPAAVASAPAPSAVLSSRADAARGAASSEAGTMARQVEERIARDAEAAARAPQVGPVQAQAKRAELAAAAKTAAETPERELERIAELRRQGRHDEADKALAEFRKRHPEFRIPEPMLERVERR